MYYMDNTTPLPVNPLEALYNCISMQGNPEIMRKKTDSFIPHKILIGITPFSWFLADSKIINNYLIILIKIW